jgi:hypothetical protein
MDLQYLSPACHRDFLESIVQADMERFQNENAASIASSFRCDASMDRMQKDNQFLLLKTISEKGQEHVRFIGIGCVTGRGAEGHLNAIKEGAKDTIGFEAIINNVTHLSTDGEAKNVGRHQGLWSLLDRERREREIKLPFLKSVCAVHNSSLALKDVCKSVPEIAHLIDKLSGLATYFHTSAMRTAELEAIAKEHGLTLRRLPKYFEVRWAQFSLALFDAVLCSWQALIKFCTSSDSSHASGFGKVLSNSYNLRLMCFLADILFLLSNFQKRLQSDRLTIVDMPQEVANFQKKLTALQNKPILGGWEEALETDLVDGMFHGVQLLEKERRSTNKHLFVTQQRDFAAIRSETIHAMQHFMECRMSLSDTFTVAATKFVNFRADDNEIRAVQQEFAPDLVLAAIADQYSDIREREDVKLKSGRDILPEICQLPEFEELTTVLARILVCKPHSADCERIISSYNLLKTASRSSIDRKTISYYLHVRVNMPPLSAFDARPAAMKWIHAKQRRARETPKITQQEWMTAFQVEAVSEEPSIAEEKPMRRTF